MKTKASFVETPLITDVNNEHYGHLLTRLQDVEGFHKRNNVKYNDKLKYLDIEKWNADEKYQEGFFQNFLKYCDNYKIFPHLITFKLKKEFERDPADNKWHLMRQDALLLYSNYAIKTDNFESLYDEVDEFKEYEKIFEKIVYASDFTITGDVDYYEYIKIKSVTFEDFVFYINHSIQHENEKREVEERHNQKEGLYKILGITAAMLIILGGLGSCVYWVNSLPEAPPKGVMDNPEIKQWMKKNMDKRGDRYYLKPDK